MSVIANRYIGALSELQTNKEEIAIYEKALKEIATVFESNKEFKKVMLDPRIVANVKMEIIKEIFADYTKNTLLMNFIALLLKEGRISYISEISEQYENMNNSELKIKIIVANRIDENQIEEIVEKFKQKYKVNKVKYKIETDRNIIGGIKIIVGNQIYDGSISTQLKQMI